MDRMKGKQIPVGLSGRGSRGRFRPGVAKAIGEPEM